MNTTPFEKLKLTLRSELLGFAKFDSRYYQCVKALDVASKIHVNKRKGGGEEFSHQINMLSFAMSIHAMLEKPYLVYTTILFHDTDEDYPEYVPDGYEDTCQCFQDYLSIEFAEEKEFILRINKEVHVYDGIDSEGNKKFITTKKSKETYYGEMANCSVCSVAKGIDRHHNISTMQGVFKVEKQYSYINDVDNDFLPMLKVARNKFIKQKPVYELLKSILNVHCNTIRHFLDNLTKQNKNDIT
jgi:hypothetical protein